MISRLSSEQSCYLDNHSTFEYHTEGTESHRLEANEMKKMMVSVGLLVVMLCFTTATAQFKSKVEPRQTVSESIMRTDGGSFLFGWFDPSKFNMRHSFSLSYQTFGGQGLSMGIYTNSMMYKFSDDLDIQADVSLMASPFNSFGKQAQNSLNGLFLNRAELNYRPWKNALFQIQYQQLPPIYWLNSGYRSWNAFDGIDRYQEDNR